MINLKNLVKVAPLTEDAKNEILEKQASFSTEKLQEVEEFLWEAISADYQNKINLKKQTLIAEMQNNKTSYPKGKFEKIGDELFNELVQKLEVADEGEKIEEIREKLVSSSNQT